MGGSVFIGIRRRNGEFFLSRRWTNPTSVWFNDPDFYAEDEATLQDYIDGEEDDPQTVINPSEYGVILVDLIRRRVLSRQDYTRIGGMHTNFSDLEKMEVIQKIKVKGFLKSIRTLLPMDQEASPWGVADKERIITLGDAALGQYFELLDEMIVAERAWEERGDRFEPQPSYNSEDPRLRMFYDVTWEIPGLEVDDTAGARGYRHWQDVLKWVAENEWTTPIMTIAEVARKYGLD